VPATQSHPAPTAADDAYDYAKERILDGRFAGGELISEGDVAEPTGLSRTPVREAFLRLQSEGLLRLYPKRGALVVPVSPIEVESVMETRLLVERFAIEKVCSARVDLTAELEVEIERQLLFRAADDASGFVEADREFHRILIAAAGNPILLDLYDSLRDRQSRMGLTAIARAADRTDTILREHRELVATIADGDVANALALLDEHLGQALRLLRTSISGGAL
jgi:DNA-binding GntR family transcriptional regulator